MFSHSEVLVGNDLTNQGVAGSFCDSPQGSASDEWIGDTQYGPQADHGDVITYHYRTREVKKVPLAQGMNQ